MRHSHKVGYIYALTDMVPYPEVLVLYLERPRAKNWELRRCVGRFRYSTKACRYLYRVTASQVCGRMSTQILSKRSGARFDVLGLPTQVLLNNSVCQSWAETASRLDAYKRSSRLFGYISAHRFLAGFRSIAIVLTKIQLV